MEFDNREELVKRANKVIWDKYQDRRKNDLKVVMSTVEGRRFIAHLFGLLNFRKDINNVNGSEKDRLLGRRSVCVMIFDDIKQYGLYDLYQQMEREDVELQQSEELEAKKLVESFPKGR